jgi:DnaJ-class molecular chaperone
MTLPERRLNEPPADPREVVCPNCKGTGEVLWDHAGQFYETCDTCNGSGRIIDDEPD